MPRRCGETRLVADTFGQWPDPLFTAGTGLIGSPRAIVMPDPVKQFRDQNGRPYVNGQLWSYRAGTLVLLQTFRDAALTIPHENPVTLDLDGRATIYLAQQIYKFILQTANGVTVWEQDEVQGTVWTGAVAGLSVVTTLAGESVAAHRFASETRKAATGTHSWVMGTLIDATLICPGSAGVTTAATLVIANAPTVATTNYALWVAAVSLARPVARFDGPVSFGNGLTAIGTGATATLGTTGSSGPSQAAQQGWQRFIRADGTVGFIPYWVGGPPVTGDTILKYSGPSTGIVNLAASVVGTAVLNLSPGVWTLTVTGQATMTVTCASPGGGGGGDTGAGPSNGGGGGGGGARGSTDVVMVPTKVYVATVGSSGLGQAGVGSDAGDTIFGEETLNLVILRGGKGGGGSGDPFGGAGGLAVGGSGLVAGGAGGAGAAAGNFGNGGLVNVDGPGGGGGGSGGGGGGIFGGHGGGSAGMTFAGGAGGAIGEAGQPGAGTVSPAQGGASGGGEGAGGGGGGGGGARLSDGIGYGGGGGGAAASAGHGAVPGGNGGPGGTVFVLKSLP